MTPERISAIFSEVQRHSSKLQIPKLFEAIAAESQRELADARAEAIETCAKIAESGRVILFGQRNQTATIPMTGEEIAERLRRLQVEGRGEQKP